MSHKRSRDKDIRKDIVEAIDQNAAFAVGGEGRRTTQRCNLELPDIRDRRF